MTTLALSRTLRRLSSDRGLTARISAFETDLFDLPPHPLAPAELEVFLRTAVDAFRASCCEVLLCFAPFDIEAADSWYLAAWRHVCSI